MQRYFITVEGFTDQTGATAYNDQLSRERANQVISYLVGSHDIPVYRIHMVGLGEQKLIDEGKGKKAREESRRVEITVYTRQAADALQRLSVSYLNCDLGRDADRLPGTRAPRFGSRLRLRTPASNPDLRSHFCCLCRGTLYVCA